MIRAGIIGGAGYTAGELIRLLLAHPAGPRSPSSTARRNAGNRLADVHGGLEGDTDMRFCDSYDLRGYRRRVPLLGTRRRAANGWRRMRCRQA